MDPSRDGAQEVQVGQQGLRRGRVGADRRAWRVVGDAEHEQRIGEDERARGFWTGDVDLIEPPDLAGGQPVRRDRLDEAHAVGRVGARQRHAVLHRGMGDEVPVAHVLLNRRGERAHQTQAPRHPADTPVEAPRQVLQRQAVILVQRAQQPALLERAVGRVGVQHLAEDQRLRLGHLPHDRGHGVAVQATQAADAFVAIHHDVRRGGGHDHDRGLLPGVGQRRQEPALARRVAHPQPLIAQIQLMKFQLHGPSVRRGRLWHLADHVLQAVRGKSAATPNTASHLPGLLVLRGSRGKSDWFPCGIKYLGYPLVLHGHQQDSTEMAEEIGAGDAEFFLGEIPRQPRERGREYQRRDAALGLVGHQSAALDAMRDEVVGITPTPRGLRPRAASDLTGRRRTRALATADAAVRHKPPTADTAGPLREHPEMLASSAA